MIKFEDLKVGDVIYTSAFGIRKKLKIESLEDGFIAKCIKCIDCNSESSNNELTFYTNDIARWSFVATTQKKADRLYVAFLEKQIAKVEKIKSDFLKTIKNGK